MACVCKDLGAWELCGNHIGLPLAHLRVMGKNTDLNNKDSACGSLTTQSHTVESEPHTSTSATDKRRGSMHDDIALKISQVSHKEDVLLGHTLAM